MTPADHELVPLDLVDALGQLRHPEFVGDIHVNVLRILFLFQGEDTGRAFRHPPHSLGRERIAPNGLRASVKSTAVCRTEARNMLL